ncbi:hypothetical protein Tco_0869006 [Tanacetum coccineum]
MVEKTKLDEDTQGKAVDPTHYRVKGGHPNVSNSQRPTLTFVVAWCSGLCYPKDSSIAPKHLKADVDPKRVAKITRRSTSGTNIFTKALQRERIEFLINKLGMRSFTLETLKQLADEADE